MANDMGDETDHIPRLVQQHEALLTTKRLTDLSLSSCLDSSNPDVSPEYRGSRGTSAESVTLASADCIDGRMKDVFHSGHVSCYQCDNEAGEAMLSQGSESSPQGSILDQPTPRNEDRGDDDQKLGLTPDNLEEAKCQHSFGNLFQAHDDDDGHKTSSDEFIDDHINDHSHSDNHDFSGCPTSQSKSTSASQVEGDSEESGRGKRKRKPKVLFSVQSSPSKSSKKSMKKLRRFKIMRSLGLTAPFGSPFVLQN